MNIVTVVRTGDRMTAELHGEVDLATTPGIAAELDRELQRFPPTHLAFDLDDVAFIDSSGLALLIEYSNAATQHGRRVTLRRVPPRAQRLLEITALTGHFTLE